MGLTTQLVLIHFHGSVSTCASALGRGILLLTTSLAALLILMMASFYASCASTLKKLLCVYLAMLSECVVGRPALYSESDCFIWPWLHISKSSGVIWISQIAWNGLCSFSVWFACTVILHPHRRALIVSCWLSWTYKFMMTRGYIFNDV